MINRAALMGFIESGIHEGESYLLSLRSSALLEDGLRHNQDAHCFQVRVLGLDDEKRHLLESRGFLVRMDCSIHCYMIFDAKGNSHMATLFETDPQRITLRRKGKNYGLYSPKLKELLK